MIEINLNARPVARYVRWRQNQLNNFIRDRNALVENAVPYFCLASRAKMHCEHGRRSFLVRNILSGISWHRLGSSALIGLSRIKIKRRSTRLGAATAERRLERASFYAGKNRNEVMAEIFRCSLSRQRSRSRSVFECQFRNDY